ncbi:hypothetical protein [Micromonospora coriariae]|uniref:hypothetical protein n=1 Tax=Micromonospora coriariae TaxID=285665 RepID=UPI000B5AF7EE|nr:hypothetical protein [Micromonospora coriariae]
MQKSSIVRKGARIAIALVAAAGLSTVIAPATPAAAACSSVVDAKYATTNGSIVAGWKLVQNSACTERWGQITVDYQPDPTGIPYAIRVEREIKSPYGYYLQAAYNKISGVGAEGTWNTSHTTNTSSDSDRHRICWGYATYSGGWKAPSSWPNCTAWRY